MIRTVLDYHTQLGTSKVSKSAISLFPKKKRKTYVEPKKIQHGVFLTTT